MFKILRIVNKVLDFCNSIYAKLIYKLYNSQAIQFEIQNVCWLLK